MNKYLRKIAAVLSLTLVLTSFDCTALRAVNTAEINAVSKNFNEMTQQGDANKSDQANTAEPKPAQPNAAKADGAAKNQTATKQGEGKAETDKANTKALSKPQPKYIIAEPVKKTGARSKRSIRESGSVSDARQGLLADLSAYRDNHVQVPLGLEQAAGGGMDRAAYEDRSEIGMDRSTPEAGSTTGTPQLGGANKADKNSANSSIKFGSEPDGKNVGLEKGEKPDPKITEPEGAYLNRHLPLQARYLGDPTDPDTANEQVKNEAPPSTYSYKMHFVLRRVIQRKGEQDQYKYVEFHKPYQITVGKYPDKKHPVDGIKYKLPIKDGYKNPVPYHGDLKMFEEQAKNTDEDKKPKQITSNAVAEIEFRHGNDVQLEASDNGRKGNIYYVKKLAELQPEKKTTAEKDAEGKNQKLREEIFIYEPKEACLTLEYEFQSQGDSTKFETSPKGGSREVPSSIGADYAPKGDDMLPETKPGDDFSDDVKNGFEPANKDIHILVPETDKCGDFRVKLRLLRKNSQCIFDVAADKAEKVPTRQFAFGQTITLPKKEPKYEGYKFLGWEPDCDVYEYDVSGSRVKPVFDHKAKSDSREEIKKKLRDGLSDEEKKINGKVMDDEAQVNFALMKASKDDASAKEKGLLKEYKDTLLGNKDVTNAMPAKKITFKAHWVMNTSAKYTYSYWLEKPEDPQGDNFADKYVYLYSEPSEHDEATFTLFTPPNWDSNLPTSRPPWMKKLKDKTDKIISDANDDKSKKTNFYEWDNLNKKTYNRARFDDFFEYDENATAEANKGMYVTGDGRADCKIIFKRRRYTVVFTTRRINEEVELVSTDLPDGLRLSFKSNGRDKLGNQILENKFSASTGNESSYDAPIMTYNQGKTYVGDKEVEPQPDLQLTEEERKKAPYQFTARFGQNLDKIWPNPYENCTFTYDRNQGEYFFGWTSCSDKSAYFDTPPYSVSPHLLYDYGKYYLADRRGYYTAKTDYKENVPSVIPLLPEIHTNQAAPIITCFFTQSLDGTKYGINEWHWKVKVDTDHDKYMFPVPELIGFSAINDQDETKIKDYGISKPQSEINFGEVKLPATEKFDGDDALDWFKDYNEKLTNGDYSGKKFDLEELRKAFLKMGFGLPHDDEDDSGNSDTDDDSGNTDDDDSVVFDEMKPLAVHYLRNRYPITIQNVKNDITQNTFYDDSLLHALYSKDAKTGKEKPLVDDEKDRPDDPQKTNIVPKGWVFDGYTFDEQNKLRIDQPGYTMPDNPITVFAKWMDPQIYDLTIDLQGGHFDKLPEQSELTDYPFNDTFYKADKYPIKVKTKDGEKDVPVDKLKDCNPYSVDAITYRIKSGKNVLQFKEVPTKPGYLFLGWEAVRYKLNDKKEIQRKDGKPIEDTSYFDTYKAHEFFSFNNPMAEPMGIRAMWLPINYVPVYFEHHFFDKDNNEIGSPINVSEADLLKYIKSKDVKAFPQGLKGVVEINSNGQPGSNMAAMAVYEGKDWVLLNPEELATAYKNNYGGDLPPEITNKFIQNKFVLDREDGNHNLLTPSPNIFKFYYHTFARRFYYKTYNCVDDSGEGSGTDPRYQIMREPEKEKNDNFDYDVINYKPIHGYKLYKSDPNDQEAMQQVARFKDVDGHLVINDDKDDGNNFKFKYKDYRVLVRNSTDAATPDGYHRVVFELDRNMEFATNYQGAFNGITKGSKLKDIVDGQGKNKTISNLLGMGGELEYGVKDVDKVCKRRYIVDVADGVDDANIPLPPIQPVRFLPVSLLWIDQKGLNFYSKKLYESTPGEIEEEDLEKTLDEAVPPQPEPERNLSFLPRSKVNVKLTPKNKGTETEKDFFLSTLDLKDKGDYKDQPRWVNIQSIPASQDLICQRVSGSKRKDANGALTEPKALTDGTLARNENADNAKLEEDAVKCLHDKDCPDRASNVEGHKGEGKWEVKEPDMNKLELTDFADLTAPKDDEKFKPAAEKQDGVPAWQKKPYQKKTINVFAKGSDAPAPGGQLTPGTQPTPGGQPTPGTQPAPGTQPDQGTAPDAGQSGPCTQCDLDCNSSKFENGKLPPRIWTKAFLDKLKEIDGQPHDIFEWSASEEGAQEQTDGVEKGIFVEHKVLVNNKESTRLFEVELFGSTETELFVVNSEVPTIDVEVQKYWYGKYGQPLDFNTLSVGSAANPKPLTMEMRFMDPRILLKPQTVDLTAANKWHDWIRNVRLKFRRTSPRTYDYELHEVGDSGGTLSYGGKKFDAIYIGRCLDGFKVINREQTYGFPPVVAICDCARMGMNKAYTAADRAYTAVSEAAGKAGNYIKRQVGKLFGGNGRQTETNGQGGCSSCHLD
ncbi:hypothetical protein B7R76_03705 [Mageeibacillus indolicus]|uniref:Repeat protein n=1 Tax=Mageeibacillus indolicus TaxID=884684 RepID=A0A2J8B5G3_9FIRM|nr:InlB B-repeat-containing protein [Mageeibacillus indolicus]PNH19984.1 hypothetical protein B7R76_03705 [Mageeibacillus indolicus]